ncbi:MAG: HPr kinase/phosphatase C-terminal domain-containing protein [Paracoccus sp. (in: a-proteobacteria)]|nr:HPr kinase/phosphatase C-terminal domain-containing protein [Paracoccus sp. (in: a-proteobacteria)]
MEADKDIIHASAVALDGRGLLILGPSGAGKSALALQMMAWGALLVADDRVSLTVADGALWASAPPRLSGLIEARGVGILSAKPLERAQIVLAADLGAAAAERLPQAQQLMLRGIALALVSAPYGPHLGPALLQYLRGDRVS